MINYAQFSPASALIGGTIIGLSALVLLAVNGRISGISGIISQLLSAKNTQLKFPVVFLAGMLAGSLIGFVFLETAPPVIETSWLVIILAGFLVGFGGHLGSGCTSGHGVCGIGRFSIRSIAATCTFLLTAAITVFFN